MMSRQRCRAVTGRILASKQGQTFPNARCAREEMVPSQVATAKRPRPLLWNRVALPSCFVRGCLSWVGGSSSALALAIDLTPLVTWWPVGCSVLDLYGGLRARLRAVLRRCPHPVEGVRPSCPTEQTDKAFHVMSFCIPAARITAKFYVQTRPSGFGRAFQRTVDVAPCMMSRVFLYNYEVEYMCDGAIL